MILAHRAILGVASIIFLVVNFWLVTPLVSGVAVEHRFDWPDETANYFWSKQFATTGDLVIAEPLNELVGNQIHPRSFNVRDDGAIVPGSFLGMIVLYGLLAKVFTTHALIYFTPVLAMLAVGAFYTIIKRIFDEQVALIASLLMLLHPAWWYYSVTSMLPNVVFISFILFSLYFLFRSEKIKWWEIIVAGLLLGIAIAIRPSEAIWIGCVYVASFFYLRHKTNPVQVVVLLAVSLLALLPIFFQQQQLYGDFLSSGYSQFQSETSGSCQTCEVVQSLLLPFGFHPRLIVSNLWIHFVSRLWWVSLLSLLGLVAYLMRHRQKHEVWGYIGLSLVVYAWLSAYYGSWEFTDKLTLHLNTLGISYVRYWIPMFLLALPFVATGILFIAKMLRPRWQIAGIVALLTVFGYLSAQVVLYQKPDSIFPVKERILSYIQAAAVINDTTEPESVIVTVRKDKVLFPERKVIHTFEALSVNTHLTGLLSNIVGQVPVYYYALGPEPVLEFESGLVLSEVLHIGQEVLYKVAKKEPL